MIICRALCSQKVFDAPTVETPPGMGAVRVLGGGHAAIALLPMRQTDVVADGLGRGGRSTAADRLDHWTFGRQGTTAYSSETGTKTRNRLLQGHWRLLNVHHFGQLFILGV